MEHLDDFEDIFENRFAQETYVIQTDSPSSTDPLLDITGNFEILMTDFKIKPPKLLGIATDKDINLSFTVFYKL